MKTLNIDNHEIKLLIDSLNTRECELINSKAGKDDCFDIDTDIQYIQILLNKLEAMSRY